MNVRLRKRRFLLWALGYWCFIAGTPAFLKGQQCFTVTPQSLAIHFANQAVGTTSSATNAPVVTVANHCSSDLRISSFSLSPAEFLLAKGYTWAIPPNQSLEWGFYFRPDSAQTFTGQFTLNIQGYSPVAVALSGTGFTTGAIASMSAQSLTFQNVSVGQTSSAQKVTLTNTGSTSMTVQSFYTEPPFVVKGPAVPMVLQAGQALTVQVAFSPTASGTFPGTLVITSDVLNPVGLALNGTAKAASRLAISNFSTLPAATQSFPYFAQLTSAGGVGNVTWSLASGSSLPAGLSLSSAGSISGTLSSSVKGNAGFKVTATDSNLNSVTRQLTIPMAAPTGASCGNISWNGAGTTTPLVPLTDLGTGTYLGAEGGLYLNGSNVMPAGHDSDGVGFADSIQPLDSNGNPDPNGKYAFIALGLSVPYENFYYLQQAAMADPSLNPHLVLVNGANPNLTAGRYANSTDPIWATITNYFLPQAGVTADQVVAAWVLAIDGFPTGVFPADMTKLQGECESIAQNLHNKFPNLKLAFYSTREYGGYSNGLAHQDDPESYAYETGFAVRGMIVDQLNGDPSLNYNPANGPVMAPWLSWASYDWANGLLPRSDGLVWTCQDFINDGTHNSASGGRAKAANLLLNFLKTTDVTMPWTLASQP